MIEDLKELLDRQPFEPFRIVTTSGDTYDVASPYDGALMDDRIFYAFPGGATWVFICMSQITALEAVSKAA